ncbi:MAG: helix-turn-helix transcriptional regulator [Burkholderiales bacterium]|jgi:predicted DNA-binding transcriptional regulator YafY
MARAERLLDLIQLLRLHRRPVTGEALAAELGVSLRTLYRDVATLQAQGARIDGAPGLGYLLHEGFVLPPLMFTSDEVEALVLGSRWVADRGDTRLAAAARDALDARAPRRRQALMREWRAQQGLPEPDARC